MKIALAQINTTVGDFDGIVRKVIAFAEKAKHLGADLVAFPELTTVGYIARDLLEVSDFIEKNLRALDEITKSSERIGIAIVVGYADRNPNAGGKPLLNAAALCRDGKIQARYFKNLLPTYDVFDEGRYFEPGREGQVWSVLPAQPFGISICEDCWNDKSFWKKPHYDRDPIEREIQKGAKLLLNLSASPFSTQKVSLRREMLSALARRHQTPLFYVNLVGGNDELVFDGRSVVFNAQGEMVAEAKAFEEDLLIVDSSDLKSGSVVPIAKDSELIYRALVLGVRDYARKTGFKKVTLGLSGGIDSSLTAVIAAEAVGAGNVLGVAMPSPYSSQGSLDDAEALAKNLEIKFEVHPIQEVYQSYRHLLRRPETNDETQPDLAEENIQARIRGNILMALSNRHGYLVLSTGNKSELAVGYCTLYGDMSGGMSVISDVPKTMVYEVSRFANSLKPVIPESVFTKAPSAELRPNQTDQDSLPPYEILDGILAAAIEENRSAGEIEKMGYERDVVERILGLVQKNEYKRRQAAPGIKVTSKAFGIGRRFPIARKISS